MSTGTVIVAVKASSSYFHSEQIKVYYSSIWILYMQINMF